MTRIAQAIPTPPPETVPSAAVIVIGDEILSGRTQDLNVQTLALFLAPLGIAIGEVRFVRDVHDEIVLALNALRSRVTYVFTTGGIGPTHDDITADAVAVAFGVAIEEHADALARLVLRYGEADLNAARRRMARIPAGATLIDNPVSGAPGFQIENVFVLAGVPGIMRGMLQDIPHRLSRAEPTQAITWRGAGVREGDIAEPLRALALEYPALGFGSYPWFEPQGQRPGPVMAPVMAQGPGEGTSPDSAHFGRPDGYGTHIVIRGRDTVALQSASQKVEALILNCGCPAVRIDP
jgi:molybdenum cofactor synthesis domain-containing protein